MGAPSKGLCYQYADPVRDANAYFTAYEAWLDTLPLCSDCDEPIQDEYFFRFDADDINICPDCLYRRFGILGDDMFNRIKKDYKTNTEDWMAGN